MANSGKRKKEEILNVPNTLTIIRIILTFVVIYLILTKSELKTVVAVFVIAAITDFLDGQIARRFNLTTEFGRKADVIADRFLWVGTAFAFLVSFRMEFMAVEGVQLLLIMSREIIATPFALSSFFTGKGIPKTRTIGKATTFIQGFALPSLILSFSYPIFLYVSAPLSLILGILGTSSALYYIKDLQSMEVK